MAVAPISAYYKQVLDIDNVTWTPVIPDASGVAGINYLGIKNATAFEMYMRTDSADPTTQDTIYPGSIESVEAAPWANSQPLGNIRFLNGSTVCYLQMSQGTGEAVITGLV